jgi:DNA-binding beta-propeller fold protein YncE
MTLVRAAGSTGLVMLLLICLGCGNTYRPVAVPIIPNPPNPGFSKAVFVISDNGPQNPGTSSQIDVSGDTTLGVVKTGVGSVHATLTADQSKIYVANELDDTISEFPPGSPNTSNPNPVTTISLPQGSKPVFVTTSQNNAVYAANFGTGTVAAISTSLNAVIQIIQLSQAGQPVAMAETPDGNKLYVANQGNGGAGSVASINPTDNSVNAPVANSWSSPVWVVSRSDSARAYVLDSGAGKVFTIDTSSDSVLPGPVAVGVSANFMLYDNTRNRLYVTNPSAGSVSIIDASTDPPSLLATDCVVQGAVPPCPATYAPVSVAALPDGSAAYVASYQLSSTCSGVAAPCITSQVSVINANSNQVSSVISLGSVGIDMTDPTFCGAPNAVSTPLSARFRLSVAASGDSSRVYVASCDAQSTAIISAVPTSSDPFPPNTIITQIQAPVSAFPPALSTPGLPPPQNPVFVLASH